VPTRRQNQEARHRWTTVEKRDLVAKSAALAGEGMVTVSEAADALYVLVGHPRQAVYAQLYAAFIRGRAPWLTMRRSDRADFSPAFSAAIREMARVMRTESLSDVLVSITATGTASVEVSHRTKKTTTNLEID
jgi:hypothetical protein